MVNPTETLLLEENEWEPIICELAKILTPLGIDFVVVGGMVLWVLFADNPDQPEGTKDLDLVIRPSASHAAKEIKQILNEHGYKDEDPENPNRYIKTLPGKSKKIMVDFLTSISEQKQENGTAIAQEGIHNYPSIFFELAFKDPVIKNVGIPGKIQIEAKFANIAILIILKAVAIGTRREPRLLFLGLRCLIFWWSRRGRLRRGLWRGRNDTTCTVSYLGKALILENHKSNRSAWRNLCHLFSEITYV